VLLLLFLLINVCFTLATRTLSVKTHQDRTFVPAKTGLLAMGSFAKKSMNVTRRHVKQIKFAWT